MRLKVFVGIDLAKDKIDYCAIDFEENTLLTERNSADTT